MEKQKIQTEYIGEKETGRYLHDDGKKGAFNTNLCQTWPGFVRVSLITASYSLS